ncbi:MAG TPA: hypothetical protein VGH74_06090 [Planctomycetaceae bacterium]
MSQPCADPFQVAYNLNEQLEFDDWREDEGMARALHGVIHGKTIEFEDDPGIGDDRQVVVHLETTPPSRKWGDGIRNSAGSLADIPSLDEEMDAILHARQQATFREMEP